MTKRLFAVIMLMTILLSGCGANNNDPHSYTFYFPKEEIEFTADDGVVSAEARKLPSLSGDYKSILNEYLLGPASAGLKNPFPVGSTVLDVSIEGKRAYITLNNKFSILKDYTFTLACACLASTVFSIMDVDDVVIQAQGNFANGSISIAYSRSSFFNNDEAKSLGTATDNKE